MESSAAFLLHDIPAVTAAFIIAQLVLLLKAWQALDHISHSLSNNDSTIDSLSMSASVAPLPRYPQNSKGATNHPENGANAIEEPAGRGPRPAPRVGCISGLREVSLEEMVSARDSWSGVHWESIKLRVGPNYRKHRKKQPTTEPLLDCVGAVCACRVREVVGW